ncbi:NAD-dependent epimerase/dehydratase terH [Lasiodiplodia theobromae]|uniref:NAD-dependent epimerase/dehydratase terH n=1 Tax=Lasiodiplodia theobromae TaxID=45133 RepID=A0A5N5D585_9PEZI|nr:NAD-dependent epimerase/dehydratase terH [Lasiodiplodia theobromae]
MSIGISAVIHVASDVSLDPDPNKVIPSAVDGTLNALKTANDEPTVKRFVITSSSLAASLPNLSTEVIVTKDSWNEQAIRAARADPPYLPERSEAVYAASKALAEKAAWNFYHDDPSNRSDLIVNTVLPCANFGKILDVDKQGYPSTAGVVERLWTGKNVEHIASIPPHYAIDVQDCARLHVAAAIHPGVVGERIFAYGQRFNYDVILDIFRKRNPGRDFISNFQSEWDLAVIEPQARAEQLLRDLGRQGFTPLEESVRLNIEALS